MKKNIKWLKEEVGELNLVDTVFEADGVSYIDTAVSVMQVYDLIDQLDELEVLSQDWIGKNVEYAYFDMLDGSGRLSSATAIIKPKKLQNLLVPKQELPVIPEYIADWITRYSEKYDLYPALRLLENNTLVWGLIYEWYRMNTRKFVNAYLTGEYEVEEEPLYYALVKGHELIADEGDWTCKYWKFDTSGGYVSPSNRFSTHGRFLIEMSKSEWNKVGINDSNADFVEVGD